MTNNWTHPYGVHVSRKNADGMIYQTTIPMWVHLLLFLMVALNAFLWSGIGVWKAVEVIV